MNKTKSEPKQNKLDLALSHIERDHGGCDSNTCTLSVALKHGYDLIAISQWQGSGAAADDFPAIKINLKELQKQCAEMTAELEHVQCPHCNAVLWLPEEAGYFCDSCARDIPEEK